MDQILGVLMDLGNNPAAMTTINIFAPVLLGAILYWMIGGGIASGIARSRNRHGVQLHAADTLSRLYGDVAAAGQTWTAAQQVSAASTCEALTLQLCSRRTLSKPDMVALQAIRQLVFAPRDGGAGFDMSRFNDNALHLSRTLSGSAANALPSVKLAQKQLHEVLGTKPTTTAKKIDTATAVAPAAAKPPATAPEAAPLVTRAPPPTVVSAQTSVLAVPAPDKI